MSADLAALRNYVTAETGGQSQGETTVTVALRSMGLVVERLMVERLVVELDDGPAGGEEEDDDHDHYADEPERDHAVITSCQSPCKLMSI